MKKLLSLLCTLLLACTAWAHEYWTDPTTGIRWGYEIRNGTVSIEGKNWGTPSISPSTFGHLSIPSHIEDNPVTSIGAYAFSGCSGLTSVTIPSGVTSIEPQAFYDCSGLTSVTIPDGVTSVAYGTFSGCSGLTSVTIPPSVKDIWENAFFGCSRLTSVTIPSGVTGIWDNAFSGCGSLAPVKISAYVTFIGREAFKGCNGVSVDAGNQHYSSDSFGVLFDKYGDMLIQAPQKISEYTVPEGVTSIGWCAFSGCRSLAAVTVPKNVTAIGYGAFSGCNGVSVEADNPSYSADSSGVLFNKSGTRLIQFPGNLTEYTIPSGVTAIGNGAFSECGNLNSVTIPEGVTFIGNAAFFGCVSLTSVTIPASVTDMGDRVFETCSRLASVTISPGVTSVGNAAFCDCSSLTFVSIPDGVTSIGKRLFFGCGKLASVIIPASVTSVGASAFFNCGSLTSVEIPAGVTRIGECAFDGCSKSMFRFRGLPIQSVASSAFPSERPGFYTAEHAAAWQEVLGGPTGTWNGLSMSLGKMSLEEIPVVPSPGGPALSQEDVAAVKKLLGDDLAKAIDGGVTSVRVDGSAEEVGAALDLGIAPKTAVRGSEMTAGFALPALEVLSFDPATGALRVRVVPAAGMEIRRQPVEAVIRVVGAASLDRPMTEISEKKLNLTPYLVPETIGEFEVTPDVKHTPFIRIEAGNPREVRQASGTK